VIDIEIELIDFLILAMELLEVMPELFQLIK
jgi:hypothetical protein